MKNKSKKSKKTKDIRWRKYFVLSFFVIIAIAVVSRGLYLQYYHTDFLLEQGDNRFVRHIKNQAVRGTIFDRNGEPIAISTEVRSIWIDPSILSQNLHELPKLAYFLDRPEEDLKQLILSRQESRFYWLKRQLPPHEAKVLMDLRIPGVYEQVEYKRYYPDAEITSHILGFTDIDDNGIEGIELTYQDWLKGDDTVTRIRKDAKGRVIERTEVIDLENYHASQDLTLTIDRRIQISAYRALKAAMIKHNATAGSVVVADMRTGDILAMVNQPAGNPNRLSDRRASLLKNRAIADTFEPGSTIKPFVVAAGLESGKWKPNSIVKTGRNGYRIGKNVVRDVSPSDSMDVTTVLMKSSNIGVTRIAETLDPALLYTIYDHIGIGKKSEIRLTGEEPGRLGPLRRWQVDPFEYATKAYGYGISVNTLKLAQMYTVFGNQGSFRPLRLVKDDYYPETTAIFSPKVTEQVVLMLEAATNKAKGAGGWRANVPNFRIGGKSGTVRKIINGKYSSDHHRSFFVGIAPISDPQYVVAVMLDDPKKEGYYGGLVAAPIFSEVMRSTLRIMGTKPDALLDDVNIKLIAR
ncbi:penicillin-binding protein 2 [Ignatzschineria larvae DSM 13226]|uniref:Penicillin-binding protein 2 n=1 Tax=Ignatzschineria larvae DSM 13226 TaxID=1111732 RepID=A0ABZ3C2V0_9GAMM|nr:penicillin-binding protein 2 [Ignatzschineria larvae]